jgi:hypothetical protein
MSRAQAGDLPALLEHLEQQHRTRDAALSEPIEPRIGIRTVEVHAGVDGRPDP